MGLGTFVRTFLLSSLLMLAPGAFAGPMTAAADPATSPTRTFFTFTSSPTAWVGAGLTQTTDTAAGGTISVQRVGAASHAVEFLMSTGWHLDFVGPNNAVPTVGNYPNAPRYPFNDPNAGLTFLGNGRGDNTSTGFFTIYQADYNADGSVADFAADFTQYDEGRTSDWNTGSIRYNSAVPVPAPEPAILLPACAAALLIRRRRRATRGVASN